MASSLGTTELEFPVECSVLALDLQTSEESGLEMDAFRYTLGVLLLVGLPPGLSWWFAVHPFVGFWRKLGAKATMTVMILFFAVSVAGLVTARNTLLGADLGLRPPLFGLGVVLVVVAGYMAMKRRKYLTMRILAGIPEVEKEAERRGNLLAEGPYATIRHPRYVEVVLATFGYAAMANYLGCWVLALLTMPTIHCIVLLEERELRDRFGEEYRLYASRVPRYLPSRKKTQ